MKIIGRFLNRVFFWTYTRGSWQWDLMCLFFLLLIFGSPKTFLEEYTLQPMTPAQIVDFLVAKFKSLF